MRRTSRPSFRGRGWSALRAAGSAPCRGSASGGGERSSRRARSLPENSPRWPVVLGAASCGGPLGATLLGRRRARLHRAALVVTARRTGTVGNHRLAAVGAGDDVRRRDLVVIGSAHVALRTALASLRGGHGTSPLLDRGLLDAEQWAGG